MISDSGQHNKAYLVVRIRKLYAATAGNEMPADLFDRMEILPFNDILELITKLGEIDSNALPTGGVDGVIEEAIAKSKGG